MTDSSNQQRAAAEFKKAQRNEDRPATAYEAQALAIRAKTERLKALRLAREAAAPPAPSKAAPASRTKRPAKAKKQPSGTLAEWLADREKDGHG